MRGVIAMGTWRSSAGDDFAVIRRRRPSVVIDLEGHPDYERIIVTTRHGLELVQALQLDVAAEPADVVDLATGAIPVEPDPVPVKKARERAPKPKPVTAT